MNSNNLITDVFDFIKKKVEGLPKKVVIAGGSASGASVAARLRRLDENLEIVVFEKTEEPSYASCGMPYYLGKVIEDRDKLLVVKADALRDNFRLDLRCSTELLKINREKKTVTVKDLKNNKEYDEAYDKLVVATGSRPFIPPIPGIKECKHVYTLQQLSDMDKIFKRAENSKSCVILGGGLIGLESAEQLTKRGIKVTVVEILPHIVPPLDFEMSQILRKVLEKNGVDIMVSSGIKMFKYDEKEDVIDLDIETKNGNDVVKTNLKVSFVLVSCGARANSGPMKDAGLDVTKRGLVVVDKHLRSSDKDIYCTGDLIESINTLTNEKFFAPLANVARLHGRVVANNIMDSKDDSFKGCIASGIVRLFGITVTTIGYSEELLKRFKIPHEKVYTMEKDRPYFMPMKYQKYDIALKMLFNMKGKILGFQALGQEGVHAIANTISVALSAGLTVFQVGNLELPYCPLHGDARSSVSKLALIAAGLIDGTHEIEYLENVIGNKDVQLIDVRPEKDLKEINMTHINKIMHIPLGALRSKLKELDKSVKYVTLCNIGKSSYYASIMMKQYGFNVKFLTGGIYLYDRCYKK